MPSLNPQFSQPVKMTGKKKHNLRPEKVKNHQIEAAEIIEPPRRDHRNNLGGETDNHY